MSIGVALTVYGTGLAAAESADVDGDGRADNVQLVQARSATGGTAGWNLQVTLASGPVLTAPAGDGLPPPRILALKDVDGRPGAEVFVDTGHITTFDTVSVYTFVGGRLTVAGQLPAFGSDFGIKFGFNCQSQAGRHVIVDHAFTQGHSHRWTRRDTTYVWNGGTLVRNGHSRRHHLAGRPSAKQLGVHC